MASFTGTSGVDIAAGDTRTLTGFTGGTFAELVDGFGDTFIAFGNDDVIFAGNGGDIIAGGTGNDTLRGNGGSDRFLYNASDEIGADTIDGGTSIDILDLQFTGIADFRMSSIQSNGRTSIERLEMYGVGHEVFFNASQVSATGLASNLRIQGENSGTDIVTFENANNLNVSGFAFLAWDQSVDRIVINGTSGEDTITGSGVADTINGGDGNDLFYGSTGADIMRGAAGSDSFIYLNALDIVSDTIDGSSSDANGDEVRIAFAGTADFRSATIQSNGTTSIEVLSFYNGNHDVRFSASQVSATGLASNLIIQGDNSAADIVTFYDASELDLSGFQIINWNESVDRVIVNGTVGGDTITGSGMADTIDGGDGVDALNGGSGNDTIEGGAGTDRAVYTGAWRDYLVNRRPNGGYTVIDQRGDSPEGIDQLTSIEQLQFQNGVFDIAETLREVPVVAFQIAAQAAFRGAYFSMTIATNFNDADTTLGDAIQFAATGLPSGLALNATTGVLAGTLTTNGQTMVTITATDLSGASVSQNFGFNVRDAFTQPQLAIAAFGTSAGGWANNQTFHRDVGDINGDGRADIVGFGADGTFVSLAQTGGTYGPMYLGNNYFGAGVAGGGWSTDDRYHRELADVNGDGRQDIVGFGSAGVFVALSNGGGGFAPMAQVTNTFGFSPHAGGWSSQNIYNRSLADVNGDGRADIVGFGSAGTFVALGNTQGGFAPQALVNNQFGTNPSAGGWSRDALFHRELADINGDGRADIVGFGSAGVWVALATSGGNFGSMYLATNQFGTSPAAGGWSNQDNYVRHLADVNRDGRADIVGFGPVGTFVALGNAQGSFDSQAQLINQFGSNPSAGGWTSDDLYPRMLADINGDGDADILGFFTGGVFVSQSDML